MRVIETYPKFAKDYYSTDRKIEKKPDIITSNIILFILFSLWFVEINIIGRLFLVETIYLLIALWVFLTDFKLKVLFSPFIKNVLILCVCWLFAQIFTDLYRGTPYVDYIRGWAKILFFGCNLVAIYVLINNNKSKLILFIVAYAIGGWLQTIFSPSLAFLGGVIWKFGYSGPVITFLVLLSSSFSNKILPFLMLTALGILNLFFDFRSAALNCILAGATVLMANFYHFSRNKYLNDRKFIPRLPLIIMMAAMMILLIWKFHGLAKEYDIGIDVGQRRMQGVDSNPIWGRIEIASGLRAAMDSPIVGHGSWAKDMDYVYYLYDLRKRMGLTISPIESDLIPSHSYIIGAWVESGIMGFIFWLFIFFNAINAFKYLVLINHPLIPILSLMIIGFTWTIWFSPFGANVRIDAAFNIIMLNFILSTKKSSSNLIASNISPKI